ncbi:MAG: hypothetical protein ABF296_12970 [Oceanococcaceae bacterium]
MNFRVAGPFETPTHVALRQAAPGAWPLLLVFRVVEQHGVVYTPDDAEVADILQVLDGLPANVFHPLLGWV